MKKDSNPSRPGYHHGDLRRHLIEVGERLIEERGAEGFTLRECAKRAGVSPSAPSHHFGNMTGLLTAIATVGFDGLTEAQELALAGCPEGSGAKGERLRAIGGAYIRYAVAHPARFRVAFGHLPLDQSDPALITAGTRALDVLCRELKAWCGELKGAETAVVAFAWSTVHGYAQLLIDDHLPFVDLERDQADFLGKILEETLNLMSRALDNGRAR